MKKIWSSAKSKKARKKLYLTLLPHIVRVARKSGYAIGVHGSMTRDMDIIAVPWVDRAVPPKVLAYRIHKTVCKYHYTPEFLDADVTVKPRGRLSWALILGSGGAYIDLSVTQ